MFVHTLTDNDHRRLAEKVEEFCVLHYSNRFLSEHVEVSFTSIHTSTNPRHFAWIVNRQGGDDE